MPENLFIASYNTSTKRHAVLEDNGLTAWLYLHRPSNDPRHTGPVDKACFVYNRKPPIPVAEVKEHRGSPPPIAMGYAADSAVFSEPGNHSWTIHWSDDGEAVLLRKDGEPWCVIETDAAVNYCHSKSIAKDGPWGSPWNQARFERLTWSAG